MKSKIRFQVIAGLAALTALATLAADPPHFTLMNKHAGDMVEKARSAGNVLYQGNFSIFGEKSNSFRPVTPAVKELGEKKVWMCLLGAQKNVLDVTLQTDDFLTYNRGIARVPFSDEKALKEEIESRKGLYQLTDAGITVSVILTRIEHYNADDVKDGVDQEAWRSRNCVDGVVVITAN